MDLAMKDKKAIVTGASEGIGKAIARSLAREGVDVAICARRKEPLEKTAAEIAKETGRKIFRSPPISPSLPKRKTSSSRRTPRSAGSTFWSTMPVRRPAASSNI